jgi:hypothetical protein
MKAGATTRVMSAELTSQLSARLQTQIALTEVQETENVFTFEVPAGTVDVELWQLWEIVSRQLVERPRD